jgi:predicted MFS family arabinose efflux permease
MSIPRKTVPEQQTAAAPRLPSLWRNRDFVLLWSGQAISSVGGEVSSLALPLLILALTGSPAQAGLAAGLGALPAVVLGLPAGALLDRWDRKRVMIWCDVVRALNMASIVVALGLGHLVVVQLYLVAMVEGACAAVFRIARISALPRVVPREQMGAAVGQNEAVESAVTLIGPPVGGLIFGLGRALPFLADALSYAASVGSLLCIRARFQGERSTSPRHLGREIVEGLRWLWHQPLVRFMALVYAAFGLLLPGEGLAVIVLAQQRGATPALIGVVFAAGGAAGFVGALLGPWVQRRARLGQVLPALHWLYALTMVLYVLLPGVAGLALAEALAMVVDQVYDVVWPSYRMALIPDALQARVTSAYRLFPSALRPVGLALAGILIQRIGAGPTLYVLGAGLGVLAIVVTLDPHLRHAPHMPGGDPD